MSRHCSYNNSDCANFSSPTIWVFIILLIFGAGGSANCNFWKGYCNAFGSSSFNTTSFTTNNNSNSNFNNMFSPNDSN